MLNKNNKPKIPYFVTAEIAQYFECSYCCDHAIVLVCGDEKFFITDGRYSIEAKESVKVGVEVIETSDLLESLAVLLKKQKLSQLLFDSLHTSIETFQKLQSLVPCVELIAQANFHQELRKVKTQEEIDKIKISQKLNKEAFQEFGKFLENAIGKSEKELQFISKSFLTHNGLYGLSFEPIFALNGNGAKPHALPMQESFLKKGGLILFDSGVCDEHYCSDQTRCAFFEEEIDFIKDQKSKNKTFQTIYEIVREARDYAITNLEEGMKAKEASVLARNVIEKKGYGDFFVYSTGRGIGLDIRELPRISPKSEGVITEGMVFSIEPGIYLPNEVGVRLEDLVVVKNGKAEVL